MNKMPWKVCQVVSPGKVSKTAVRFLYEPCARWYSITPAPGCHSVCPL